MIKNHKVYYPLYEDKDKFIILVTGGRGCENPNQEIIMADLTTKKLRDVKVGDKVMGDDFTPRNVVGTISGRSMMYKVHQTSAEDYVVNNAHIISVRKSASAMNDKGGLTKNGTYRRPKGRYPQYDEFSDMNVLDYMKGSKRFRENFRGYKVNSIPFEEREVEIEPYMLGLWIGDGTSIFPNITNPDTEIINYLYQYAESIGCEVHPHSKKGTECLTYIIAKKNGNENPFIQKLKHYDLIGNKHIPQEYISNSERVRLELLAGLLDTDGHMERNGYEIIQKTEGIARSIKYIADTLGFRTSISEKRTAIYDKDCGIAYRVFINGDTWRIPCKVARKIVTREMCHKNKDWHLSYLSVEQVGVGDWCGIRLDGNQRYLHADGTVTHNSGKSYGTSAFIERLTFEMQKARIDDGEIKKIVHNILYTRYTMTSASISVIPEFWEKVEADGTERYFQKTKSDIKNIKTGAKIMFRGIKTSSGNQTAKLKSIHGITTFVVDEAEEWRNEQEFDTIMLSLRQKGIQNRVIIIMNPTDSNHFIYQKYIKDSYKEVMYDGVPVQISTHPNVLHIHTTYLDNYEHLSEQFIKEVTTMKERNPEKYAHQVIGRWADVAEGAIFKKVFDCDEFPADCTKVAFGMDLGFTNDPTALIKCGIKDNCLYVDEHVYETGLLVHELIQKCKDATKKEDGTRYAIYSESADPRMIQELSLGGLIIYPIDKSGNSIIAGIEKIKDFDAIYVTKRSYNTRGEYRNYTWAKDANGNFINQPIDLYNHAQDAIRYWCLGVLLGKILKPKHFTGDLGIY